MNDSVAKRAFGVIKANVADVSVGYNKIDQVIPLCLHKFDNHTINVIINAVKRVMLKYDCMPKQIQEKIIQKYQLTAYELKEICVYTLNNKLYQKVFQPPRDGTQLGDDPSSFLDVLQKENINSENILNAIGTNGALNVNQKLNNLSNHINYSRMSSGQSSNLSMEDISGRNCSERSFREFSCGEEAFVAGTDISCFKGTDIDYDFTKRIYNHLRITEMQTSLIKSNILELSPQITNDMRGILVDWLHEVALEYSLKWETLLLAIEICDHYVAVSTVAKSKLQLIGMTCLWVAAKMEEIHPPAVSQFVYIADNAYIKADVIECEQNILEGLKWHITFPTACDFCTHLYKFFGAERSIEKHAEFFVDLFLQTQDFLKYTSSEVAAGAVLLSIIYDKKHNWADDICNYSGYKVSDLYHICREMNNTYRAALGRVKKRASYNKHVNKRRKNWIHPYTKWNILIDAYSKHNPLAL